MDIADAVKRLARVSASSSRRVRLMHQHFGPFSSISLVSLVSDSSGSNSTSQSSRAATSVRIRCCPSTIRHFRSWPLSVEGRSPKSSGLFASQKTKLPHGVFRIAIIVWPVVEATAAAGCAPHESSNTWNCRRREWS